MTSRSAALTQVLRTHGSPTRRRRLLLLLLLLLLLPCDTGHYAVRHHA
eukprot:COSAG01_NODE_46812_length_396_cov_2.589226_1_plen_47_part_01